LIVRRLTSRLLHTAKAKSFRQAIELIRLLIKTDNLNQAVQLIRLLNRTNSLDQAVRLIRLLHRTGRMRKALKLVRSLNKQGNFFLISAASSGHYYSPFPNPKEIAARSQTLFDRSITECPGIELREDAQVELLESFARYYNEFPFSMQPREAMRYYSGQRWYSHADAIILYSMLRHYEPDRVIEVGSGFSSAAMLDVNDAFLNGRVQFTFVEPNPEERLLDLLTPEDKDESTILRSQVQDVPLKVFHTLSANDILFIDSSHVAKVGSDVVHIIFNVLPQLKPGVMIHFHDVFWPFEYPQEWFSWMAWNEAYLLRAFLQFNDAFEIVYFSSFMAEHYANILRRRMPLHLEPSQYTPKGVNPGSSLWLRKVI
jgi:predicted O-methyltransferase YrrM